MHINFEYIVSLTSTPSEVYKAFRQYLLQTDSTRVRPEFKKKVSKDLYYCLRNKKIDEMSAQELDKYNCNFYGDVNPPGRHEWLLGTNDYKFAEGLRTVAKSAKNGRQEAMQDLAQAYPTSFDAPETHQAIMELDSDIEEWCTILEQIIHERGKKEQVGEAA